MTSEPRMKAFHILSRAEQAAAIRRLHSVGYSDHGIANATRLSVEFIRHVIGDRQEERA